MHRTTSLLAVLVLLGLGLPACGGGGDSGGGERQLTGTWEVRIDPDRTVRLELNGSFDVTEDKADAKAGKTNIEAKTYGSITATNVSDGRNADGIKTGLELFVPIASCPDWAELDPKGTHCSRDLVSFRIPDLDVDESKQVDISGTKKVASVPSDAGKAVIDSMLGESGVVVSADRVFWNQYLEDLNPTCDLDSDGKWVTYFSEDEAVTACSTEVGG